MNYEKENTGKEEKKRDLKNEDLYRITVSKDAENALAEILDKVNSGFEGGKVSRTQMANWVILKFRDVLSSAQVREIRLQHINEFDYLEAIFRKAKREGKIPTELKAFMNRELSLEETTTKRKRGLQEGVTNGDLGATT